MSKILSLQEILEVQDITEEEVPIPSWGGSVVVRSISHNQMRKIKKEVAARSGDDSISENEVEKQILMKGLVNPSITEEEAEHLFEKNTRSITTILNAILGQSGAEKDSVKQEEKTFPAESE